MLRIFLLLLTLLSSLISQAQQLNPPDSSRSREYEEILPVFPGGPSALLDFLSDSMQYPKSALHDQVQGKVFISFVVNAEGHTTDIKIKKGVRADLDEEALRVAQRLKQVRWQPGTQNRKPVNVEYTVPLTFRINNGLYAFQTDSLDQIRIPKFLLPSSGWTASRGPLPPDKGLIYGNCVQRLGFSSGGLLQDVQLVNLDTRKVVRVVVKPTMSSRKENEFCVALPPGRYALHTYSYSYGMEPLRKGQAGAITDTRYVFVVQAGLVNYVGTWDFSAPQRPRFTIDQAALTDRINPIYTKLGFAEAVLAVPQ